MSIHPIGVKSGGVFLLSYNIGQLRFAPIYAVKVPCFYRRMANRTIVQQIAVLEARRDALEAAITSGAGGISSSSIEGMSIARTSISALSAELTRVEKSLQRLYRGGRGFQIDLSSGTAANDSTNINETYTTRVV